MSNLVARILLSLFMVPLAIVIYIVTAMYVSFQYRFGSGPEFVAIIAGSICWGFMAIYWTLLWYRQVTWNTRRTIGTLVLVVAAIAAGCGIAVGLSRIERGIGEVFGSIVAPILWLIGTVFLWKETKSERAARINATATDAVACPVCGYNLTGLAEARCPECGAKFTLNELFANQPARQLASLDKEVIG